MAEVEYKEPDLFEKIDLSLVGDLEAIYDDQNFRDLFETVEPYLDHDERMSIGVIQLVRYYINFLDVKEKPLVSLQLISEIDAHVGHYFNSIACQRYIGHYFNVDEYVSFNELQRQEFFMIKNLFNSDEVQN